MLDADLDGGDGDAADANGDAADAADGICPTAAGAGSPRLIDNFEDGDGELIRQDDRSGSWFVFNDGSGMQMPEPTDPITASAGGANSTFAMRTSGSNFTGFGAVLGADFVSAGTACPYDASVYSGIRFAAVANLGIGTTTMRVLLVTPATLATEQGGECTASCGNHFGADVALTGSFDIFSLDWGDLAQLGAGGAEFDQRELLSIQFLLAGPAFDISIDDLEFLP